MEVWTPLVVPAFEPGALGLNFPALGRLRPGVTPERAAAEADTVLNADRSPSDPRPRLKARVIPLQEEMLRGYRPALVLLSAVTALVLAIACINVAGLFLAHGVARRRELAVRGALGAGRGRIVRQLLTESVVLGVAGGALGLAAAALILRGAPALAPGDVPRLEEVGVDGTVLGFVAGLSVVAGLLFGAVPALAWSRLHLVRALGEGSARAAGGFRILSANRIRAALAVTQVGLALVLLVGAGLLLRGFVRLVSVDPGYDAGNVLTATVNHPDLGRLILAGDFEAAGESAGRFTDALPERLARMEALPAIEAVGLSTALPFIYDGWPMPVLVPGRPEPANPLDFPRARVRMASPGYFDVMRLRLRRGRGLTRLDGPGSPRVAVVNESLERELFDGEPAVGRRLQLGPLGGPLQVGGDDELWEVVGVVADVGYDDLAASESSAAAYIPLRQGGASPFPMLNPPLISVRTTGNPLAVVPFLREAVADVHPHAALDDVTTMEARLSSSVAQPRFQTVFVAGFGAVALLLAMLGVYGLLSYSVAQRRGEIGIRMALGAQARHVLGLIVRQGALLVAAGVALGLPAAAASSRMLESSLFGVATGDRLTFVAAPLVLIAVVLVACWLPARRAARIDPLETLRSEIAPAIDARQRLRVGGAYNSSMHAAYDALLADLVSECRRHYSDDLRVVAVYGSVGRGVPRPDSDVDLLIVAERLADRHALRVRDFRRVETALASRLDEAAAAGLHPDLSPVLMTPAELERGSMLLLDMTEDARILFDPAGCLAGALDRLRGRLRELGSRRIWLGNAWYWDLKPDYKLGDVFDLFAS